MLVHIFSGIDKFHKLICKIFVNFATVLLFIMTAIIVLQVTLRYFFNSPLPWPEELAVYLMLWMSYLCLPYLIYSDKNISMTLVSDRFKNTKFQYILEIIYVIFIVFTGFIWYPFAIKAFTSGMGVRLVQLPLTVAMIYAIIPVSLLFMITIAIQRLFTSLCFLLNLFPKDCGIGVDPFQSVSENPSEEG
ncbi:MAG: TRAP transporter small permease [Brevinema sp.]